MRCTRLFGGIAAARRTITAHGWPLWTVRVASRDTVASVGNARVRGLVAVVLAVAGLIGCGGTPTPSAQIRSSFKQLVSALRDRDAQTACELIFAFGEHQPQTELIAELRGSGTAKGQAAYQAQVKDCIPTLTEPRNSSAYYRGLASIALGPLIIHGDIATAPATARGRRPFPLRFVKVAGEWRLLIGVQ